MPDPKDNRPTPPSGLPAASLLLEAVPSGPSIRRDTQESRSEDISIPKSEATLAILASIDGLRTDVTNRQDRFEGRIEKRVDDVGYRVEEVERLVGALDHRVEEQHLEHMKSFAEVARAAASAANLALEAKQQASEATANVQSMIESALAIHGQGLAGMVDAAVTRAVEPIAEQVQKLTDLDETRSKDINKTNEALGAVVNELGIEDKAELGREVHPGDPKPRRTLRRIDRRLTLVSVLGSIAIIFECLVKILHL